MAGQVVSLCLGLKYTPVGYCCKCCALYCTLLLLQLIRTFTAFVDACCVASMLGVFYINTAVLDRLCLSVYYWTFEAIINVTFSRTEPYTHTADR